MEYDDHELVNHVRGFKRRFDNEISNVIEREAPVATAWMKANAPWHDNTGAARASLHAVANRHELLLSHGVHYGIWLEVAQNRRYQILESAQRHVGGKIMGDLREAFREALR